MSPEQFAYWLQGFLEVSETKEMTAEQVDVMRRHLATVFKNITAKPRPRDPAGPVRFC